MAKCDICGKSVQFGNNVSHSNRKTNRIWKPNIKRVKCKVNGAPRRLHVCTNCLKSGKVERAQILFKAGWQHQINTLLRELS